MATLGLPVRRVGLTHPLSAVPDWFSRSSSGGCGAGALCDPSARFRRAVLAEAAGSLAFGSAGRKPVGYVRDAPSQRVGAQLQGRGEIAGADPPAERHTIVDDPQVHQIRISKYSEDIDSRTVHPSVNPVRRGHLPVAHSFHPFVTRPFTASTTPPHFFPVAHNPLPFRLSIFTAEATRRSRLPCRWSISSVRRRRFRVR
jgi:hypothetical protein